MPPRVPPNQLPIVNFFVTGHMYVGQPISINAKGTVDYDGRIIKMTYDYGDGYVTTTKKPGVVDHVYSVEGTYTVNVIAEDNRHANGKKTMQIAILRIGTSEVLVPSQTAQYYSIDGNPVTVAYPPPPSPSGGVPPYTITYSIADGSLFPVGTTNVTMTATDSIGGTGTGTLNVTVTYTANIPVDCVLSGKITDSVVLGPCQPNGSQVVTTNWHKTIVTAPENGGAACGPTTGADITSQSCTYVPPDPGDQSLLDTSRMTWLGSFQAPIATVQNGGAPLYPIMTCRRVGSTLKMIWLGVSHGGFGPPYNLIEADYPGYNANIALAPESLTGVRNFGNSFMSKMLDYSGVASVSMIVNGIHWDTQQNCLWIQYAEVYNTSQQNDPVLIRCEINDAAPDASALSSYGPFRFTGSASGTTAAPNSHQVQSFCVTVPQDYGNAYLGGANIAMGGTYSSGGISSPYSNNLWAAAAPTSATVPSPGGPDIPATALLGGDITLAHRGRRPGDYTTQFCPAAGNGDTDSADYDRATLGGYFGVLDYTGFANWIDWDDLRGVIFVVSHARGHIWYNNAGLQPPTGHCNHGVVDRYVVTGPESVVSPTLNPGTSYGTGPDKECAFYIYDPLLFAPVVAGNIWGIAVHDWCYVRDEFPNFAVDATPNTYIYNNFQGLASDETSRLIFVPVTFPDGGISGRFYCNVFVVS